MNARSLLHIVSLRDGHTPPVRNPVAPEPARGHRVQLSPIPWGTRDPELGKGICRHTLEATPPTVIAFQPRTDAAMRRGLRSLGVHH